ncbi:MAG: YbjQ family protein [Candidatus Riflebacteria bacterium]|nr:YbjQ family protein [Candidatus Riflebacteria bacterium]
MDNLLELAITVFFFILFTAGPLYFWYRVGKHYENKHFASIKEREARFNNLPFSPSDTLDESKHVEALMLVTGQVVIGSDPFKRYIASLVNLVGGRISVFEAPLDRARREAILRMKEKAAKMQADEVINFRMDTMSVGSSKGGEPMGIVEVVAYGTAIRYSK